MIPTIAYASKPSDWPVKVEQRNEFKVLLVPSSHSLATCKFRGKASFIVPDYMTRVHVLSYSPYNLYIVPKSEDN